MNKMFKSENSQARWREMFEGHGLEFPSEGVLVGPGWIEPVNKMIPILLGSGWNGKTLSLKKRNGCLKFKVDSAIKSTLTVIKGFEELTGYMCEFCGEPSTGLDSDGNKSCEMHGGNVEVD
jgi:hypothetical protein